MEREFKPNIDIWLPAICVACRGNELAAFVVWEKIKGEMTLIELEDLVKWAIA